MMDIFELGEDGERFCMKGKVDLDRAKELVGNHLKECGVIDEYASGFDLNITHDKGWWGFSDAGRMSDLQFVYADYEDDAPYWTFALLIPQEAIDREKFLKKKDRAINAAVQEVTRWQNRYSEDHDPLGGPGEYKGPKTFEQAAAIAAGTAIEEYIKDDE